MIPKKIHYVWFGGAPLTSLAEQCMSSWNRYCPDYEIVRWDESNFDSKTNQYCSEAYDEGKWAFVSDYVRLWALVNYGGVYMDTDVELLAPLDEFLPNEAFSGFESDGRVPTGLMASEAHQPLFEELLRDYDTRRFRMPDGTLNTTTNVTYITESCLKYGLVPDNTFQVVHGFALYPSDYFCPKSHDTGIVSLTDNSRAIHHFDGSWLEPPQRAVARRKHELFERHPRWPKGLVKALCWLSYVCESGDAKALFRKLAKRGK